MATKKTNNKNKTTISKEKKVVITPKEEPKAVIIEDSEENKPFIGVFEPVTELPIIGGDPLDIHKEVSTKFYVQPPLEHGTKEVENENQLEENITDFDDILNTMDIENLSDEEIERLRQEFENPSNKIDELLGNNPTPETLKDVIEKELERTAEIEEKLTKIIEPKIQGKPKTFQEIFGYDWNGTNYI